MSERWSPKDKSELVNGIEREWKALMQVIERLNEKQMTTPASDGWSPKDQLAHLAEWMKSLMGYHLEHRPWHEVLSVDKELTEVFDFDGINAILFERNRDVSARAVMTELQRTYSELLSRLNAIPFEDLLRPRFADDPEKRPVMDWILSNTTEHFAEHREYIERAIEANR